MQWEEKEVVLGRGRRRRCLRWPYLEHNADPLTLDSMRLNRRMTRLVSALRGTLVRDVRIAMATHCRRESSDSFRESHFTESRQETQVAPAKIVAVKMVGLT